MLTTLARTTLLSFRLQPTLTVLLTAAGAFGFIEATLGARAPRTARARRRRVVVGRRRARRDRRDRRSARTSPTCCAPTSPSPTPTPTATASAPTAGRPAPRSTTARSTPRSSEVTGRPRDETVVLTADYSFLSYYPYYGFQGLTSHYANPLAQFDKRAAAIEGWADAEDRRPVHRRAGQAAVAAADGVPDAPRRRATPTPCGWPRTSTPTSPTCAATRWHSTRRCSTTRASASPTSARSCWPSGSRDGADGHRDAAASRANYHLAP